MRLVGAVRIENFRSIRLLTVDDLHDFVPVIGLNSSGKSNVLRALHLFFNGFIDEADTPLDLARDFSDYAPKGKKKTVAVAVTMNLSTEFKPRGQDDFLKAHKLQSSITIERRWSLSQQTRALAETVSWGTSFDDLKVATEDEVPSLLAFVRAINFRYIPNHVRPADLIRAQLQPLRPDLITRVQGSKEYDKETVGKLMEALARLGKQMFADVSKSVRNGLSDVTLAPNLPTDFAELAFDVAVSSVSDAGVARAPELEGSGTQAFMLLHFLDLADRSARRGGFGWVQASIWAIEEPESFLHAGLRSRFALDLAEYAESPRRQVVVTTHQDEFVRVSEEAWLAQRKNDGTTLTRMPSREALAASAKSAITVYRHPLLEHPDIPIVLVEGKYDALYLRRAMAEAGLRPRWRLLSPNEALGEGTAGDALKQFLKYNQAVIASRPNSAPILVLRDWEATDAVGYQNQLAVHPYSSCVTAPPDLANPGLGESFVGIERYLPVDLIVQLIPKKDLIREGMDDTDPVGIKKPRLNAAKQAIAAHVQANTVPLGPHLQLLASWLDDQVAALLAHVPPDEFI